MSSIAKRSGGGRGPLAGRMFEAMVGVVTQWTRRWGHWRPMARARRLLRKAVVQDDIEEQYITQDVLWASEGVGHTSTTMLDHVQLMNRI